MKTRSAVLTWHVCVALALLACSAAAQPQATNAVTNAAAMPMMQPGGAMQSHAMDKMAESLTSMAEMCKTMMELEMRYHPLKVAALGIVGALLAVALVLFVILEIQWIRLLGRRIRAEKAKG